MHYVKLIPNIRLVALVAVTVAVLLAASSLTAPPRQASAVGPFAFEGVVCIQVTQGAFPAASLILARIEPSGPSSWWVTSVGYEGDTDGDTIADDNAGPLCKPLTDVGNSLTMGVDVEQVNTASRPGGPVARLNATKTALEWDGDCTFRDDINQYVLARFSIDVTGKTTLGQNTGSLNVWLRPTEAECETIANDPTPPAPTLSLVLASSVRTSTPSKGAPGPAPDDWDGDGITDWNELAKKSQFAGNGCDPFNAADDLCTVGSGSVGGVAELAEAAGTPLEAPDSSGSNTGLIAGIVAAIAASTVTLGGAAWYARRRSIQ